MIGARVLTVGAAHLAGSEDAAGLAMARALLAEGLPVLGRAVVDEDEGALEASLRAALGTAGLVVVLAASGGSSGEIVRRVVLRRPSPPSTRVGRGCRWIPTPLISALSGSKSS